MRALGSSDFILALIIGGLSSGVKTFWGRAVAWRMSAPPTVDPDTHPDLDSDSAGSGNLRDEVESPGQDGGRHGRDGGRHQPPKKAGQTCHAHP